MTGVQQQAEPQPAEALRARVRATWTAGDFGRIAVGFEGGAAEFIERLELAPGERVLDVACGTGNLALPRRARGARQRDRYRAGARGAARGSRGCRRPGDGRPRRRRGGPAVRRTASFDTVVTMFGAMFAAHPERAGGELLRVTRTGGRIAMANWMPEGFVGRMLKLTVGYVRRRPACRRCCSGATPDRAGPLGRRRERVPVQPARHGPGVPVRPRADRGAVPDMVRSDGARVRRLG